MKQAVILAAGEGRRLRPFTVNKPKAMLNIAGGPVIRYVLEALAANGIRKVILVAGYRKEQIFDFIGDGKQFGVDVTFVIQDKQLGTAHALSKAKDIVDNEFLVLAGDKLFYPDTITPLLAMNPTAMLIKRMDNPSRYGVAMVQNKQLTGIIEKPIYPESNLINTGIYAFEKSIFNFIGEKLDIPDVLNDMIHQGQTIKVLETDKTWEDIVYPWDILSLNAAILQKASSTQNGIIETGVSVTGHVSIGKGTKIHSNTYIAGPVVIGDGCEIGPNACLFPSTSIANNVVISPFSEIRNSVIGDDVHISSGASIQDSVIDRGCIIGGHFCANSEATEIVISPEAFTVKVGAMLGEGCHLGNGVVAQPGVIAGNYCQVKSMKMINGKIPDKSFVV